MGNKSDELKRIRAEERQIFEEITNFTNNFKCPIISYESRLIAGQRPLYQFVNEESLQQYMEIVRKIKKAYEEVEKQKSQNSERRSGIALKNISEKEVLESILNSNSLNLIEIKVIRKRLENIGIKEQKINKQERDEEER